MGITCQAPTESFLAGLCPRVIPAGVKADAKIRAREAIKAWALRNHLTQKQIAERWAERFGGSRTQSAVSKSFTAGPTLENLDRWADLIGQPPERLISGSVTSPVTGTLEDFGSTSPPGEEDTVLRWLLTDCDRRAVLGFLQLTPEMQRDIYDRAIRRALPPLGGRESRTKAEGG